MGKNKGEGRAGNQAQHPGDPKAQKEQLTKMSGFCREEPLGEGSPAPALENFRVGWAMPVRSTTKRIKQDVLFWPPHVYLHTGAHMCHTDTHATHVTSHPEKTVLKPP